MAAERAGRRLRGIGSSRCRVGGCSRGSSIPLLVARPAGDSWLIPGGRRDLPRAPHRRDRRRHVDRDGQAPTRGARRDAPRGPDPSVRRERGLPLRRRALRAVGDRRARVHTPPATRCRGPHHTLELPDCDSGLEARAGPDVRKHGRAEAGLRGAVDRPSRRRGVRRSEPARRRPQRAHRPWVVGGRRARR